MHIRLLILASDSRGPGIHLGLDETEFNIEGTSSLSEAVRQMLAAPPDIVLVLVDDPSEALQQCEILRALGQTPLMVAGHDLPPHVATACLDRGADSVIMLPTHPAELAARIQVVLRRATAHARDADAKSLTIGNLVLEVGARRVWRSGMLVDLTAREFQLLVRLAEHPGQVVSNGELLAHVWGPEFVDDVHYVRLYIGYLRAKLEQDPRHPRLILNQWGVGYRLAMPEELMAMS